MRHLIRLFLCLLLLVSPAQAYGERQPLSARTQEMLSRLDKAIAEKETYRQKHETEIAKQKKEARRQQGEARIGRYKNIFRYYVHVQTDSALHYLDVLRTLPETAASPTLQNYLAIGEAEVMAVRGMYNEAEMALAKIRPSAMNPDLNLYYYHTRRTLYGWMGEYTDVPDMKRHWQTLTRHYRDSILLLEPEGSGRSIVEADKAVTEGNPLLALQILERNLHATPSANSVYIYYLLSSVYRMMQDFDQMVYYLALTAVTDLERGVTEYEALTRLAEVIYDNGDTGRAYAYLSCAMEDAAFCKTRLRTIETSRIFPIIDRAYKKNESESRRLLHVFTGTLVALVGMLIVIIFFLRNRMKKLRQTRAELAKTMREMQAMNQALQATNANLQITDKMKEEYIARYLNRCRGYLDDMQEYRYFVLKHLKTKDYDTLANKVKADARMTQEQASFYADFDEAFLHLFPHFIENFNALLRPEGQIIPRRKNSLTTELRIFALIRLGVSDTGQIAHFLNNSLATIYNYRSKVRNLSHVGKEIFEEKVMQL